jgi:hypothetical protein
VIRELIPGLVHWTALHRGIRQPVSCYALPASGVLLNPLVPEEGLHWFERHGAAPSAVVLTNRHHRRDTERFQRTFSVSVHVPRAGLHEFAGGPLRVTPYADGDELPGKMRAHRVGALSADEMALHLPEQRALAFADGLIREGDGPLTFVPDGLMGEDPAGVKRGLAAAFARLAELDVDHLLLAHGDPIVGGGAEALRRFAEEHR